MELNVFEFVVILVLITTIGKAAAAIMVPIAQKLADLIAETTREKRQRREAAASPAALPADAIEALENRLARIEDRLDFLEELKAAPARRGIPAGRAPSDPAA